MDGKGAIRFIFILLLYYICFHLVCIFYRREEVAMETRNEESSPSSVSKPERVACWTEGTEEES